MFRFILSITILSCILGNAQTDPIKLFKQFNGRYSYTAIGNTLNPEENNPASTKSFCYINKHSQDTLKLDSKSSVKAAYLYWAGSGFGDKQVTLKTLTDTIPTDSISVKAQKTYNIDYSYTDKNSNSYLLTYFSCFADITSYLKTKGNGIYQLSNLDISNTLTTNAGYCKNRTNFAGWCIYVVYEDNTLPLNQVNIFQGLEIINATNTSVDITLGNINVLDKTGAKIGFLAWEGDRALAKEEQFFLNGKNLYNSINPKNNAFNGTNSFGTGKEQDSLYNMDMDVYAIENFIDNGDTKVEISATTGQDLIIFNNIITVLNSQLPDATIKANTIITNCYERVLNVNYTVFNTNATEVLPSNTPIAFYANSLLVGQSNTTTTIPIGGSEKGSIQLTIPESINEDIKLLLVIDDNGSGESTVIETDETNNTDTSPFIKLPKYITINNIEDCDKGYNTSIFNLNNAITPSIYDTYETFDFYASKENLIADIKISTPSNYTSLQTPQTVYVKANTLDDCYDILTFQLTTKNCPPIVPDGFSPNNDGKNDYFNIQGLYTIFEKHELLIYNRYGTLIFKGNDTTKWYGTSNQGINNVGKPLPVGTYFYVLNLNDANYAPLTGWVYLNK